MFRLAATQSERLELLRGRKSSPTRAELKEKLAHREKYYSRSPGSFGRAVGHGIAAEYGWSKAVSGQWEFMGGKRGWATDISKFRQAWGGATTKKGMAIAARAGLRRAGLRVLPGVSYLFAGHSIKEGYSEGGLGGAAGAALEWGAMSVGFSAAFSGIARTFKGSGTLARVGHTQGMAAARGAMSVNAGAGWNASAATLGYGSKMAPALIRATLMVGRSIAARSLALLPVMAPIGHVSAAAGRASRDIDAGHRSLGINTSSSLAAFSTKGAYTSRQMSVQAIQRSHLNARSALGNEAQYMHRRGF